MSKQNGSGGKQSQMFADLAVAVEATERFVNGKAVARWPYHRADGTVSFVVVRFETASGKVFRPFHQTTKEWIIADPPGVLPLYMLPELIRSTGRVFVVEGEKCAETLRSLGLVATTSAHGAKSAAKSDWSALAGRDVPIFPDNDDPGAGYAEDVAKFITAFQEPATVRIAKIPGLKKGEDVYDLIQQRREQGADDATIRAEIERLADDAAPWAPPRQPESLPSKSPVSSALRKLKSVPEYRPFSTEALPKPIADFVKEQTAALGVDEAMLAVPVLGVLAAGIGTTRRIKLKNSWLEPSVVWAVLVSKSGTLKSPALDAAISPVNELQRRAYRAVEEKLPDYKAAMDAYEREYAAWKKRSFEGSGPDQPAEPVPDRFIVEDTTVEALVTRLQDQPDGRGLLLARDELSGLFAFDAYKQSKGADVAHYLKMFGARDLYIDRKTGDRTHIFVSRASVSIVGGIQPRILARALGNQHFENGFAARCLLTMAPPRPKRWSKRAPDQIVVAEYHRVIESLYRLQHRRGFDAEFVPVDIPLSSEAEKVWAEFYNEHGTTQLDATTDDLAAAFAKHECYAARFALIVHCVRCIDDPTVTDDSIDADSMRAGIEIAKWFIRETQRVYAALRESAEISEARQLVEWVERHGGSTTPRNLVQQTSRFATVDDARAGLQELVDAGLGQWVDLKPGATGGHPSRVFELLRSDSTYVTPASDPENEGNVGEDRNRECESEPGGEPEAEPAACYGELTWVPDTEGFDNVPPNHPDWENGCQTEIEIPDGWEPIGWAENLERLAGLSETLDPDGAVEKRRVAAAIRSNSRGERTRQSAYCRVYLC